MKRLAAALLVFVTWSAVAAAHEVRPAYLQIRQISAETYDVLWKVPSLGNERRMTLDVEFPADTMRLSEPIGELAGGGYSERWTVRRLGGLTGATVGVPGLAITMTEVLVRLERLDGSTQALRLQPSAASFVVAAVPSALEVAATYLTLGAEHILHGIDHLLFVLALLMLVRGTVRLVATITAFTVAHSLSLGAATLGWLAVPGPPVEAVIALSIVFVAAEIVRARRRGAPGLAAQQPWLVAFAFGLLHGLGFAGSLSEIGLPPQAIPLALAFFNLGIEAGQLLFVGAALAVAWAVRRSNLAVSPALAAGASLVPAYAIGAVAAFWVIERAASFAG